jgi:hypothetical protein
MSHAHVARLALLAAVLGGHARAQTSNASWPTYEGFAGFAGTGAINLHRFNAVSASDVASLFSSRNGGPDGFDVSIARYFKSYVGLKVDFSTYFQNE